MSCACSHELLLAEGSAAADELLSHVYNVSLAKALNPLNKRDFVTLTRQFARKLEGKANPPERKVVKGAIESLDVDWVNLTSAQRGRAIDGLNNELGKLVSARLTAIPVIEAEVPKLVKSVRAATARKFKLDIPEFGGKDEALAKSIVGMQANFVSAATDGVVEDVTRWARDQVAELAAAGLGSQDIANTLANGVSAKTLGRSANYWSVVSVAFTNRARTWEQLTAYEDAGIEKYFWESVLDERTTEICRFMHGKRFTTGAALEKFRAAERAFKDRGGRGVKDTQPWMTVTRNDEGKQEIIIRTTSGQSSLATVEESGFGEVDRIGKYSNTANLQTLESLGVSTPPAHGLCRSTVVADV